MLSEKLRLKEWHVQSWTLTNRWVTSWVSGSQLRSSRPTPFLGRGDGASYNTSETDRWKPILFRIMRRSFNRNTINDATRPDRDFKVRRLHKDFLARVWGRGKQQTSYIVIYNTVTSHISKSVYERLTMYFSSRPLVQTFPDHDIYSRTVIGNYILQLQTTSSHLSRP